MHQAHDDEGGESDEEEEDELPLHCESPSLPRSKSLSALPPLRALPKESLAPPPEPKMPLLATGRSSVGTTLRAQNVTTSFDRTAGQSANAAYRIFNGVFIHSFIHSFVGSSINTLISFSFSKTCSRSNGALLLRTMAVGSVASPLLISHIARAHVFALTPWGTPLHCRRNSSRSHT